MKEFLGEPLEITVVGPTLGQINLEDLKTHMEKLSDRVVSPSSEDELLLEAMGQIKLLKLRLDIVEEKISALQNA